MREWQGDNELGEFAGPGFDVDSPPCCLTMMSCARSPRSAPFSGGASRLCDRWLRGVAAVVVFTSVEKE